MASLSWFVRHQISTSVTALTGLGLAHNVIPALRPLTTKLTSLAYPASSTGYYSRGWDDLYYIATWILVFTGLRAAFVNHIFKATARSCGILKPLRQDRFAEQSWLILYYTCSWVLGMATMYQGGYWSNFQNLWANFPIRLMSGSVKWYYLVQFAFWIQQLVVVHIEERRKDHSQMVVHHIFTCSLLLFSYGFYQTNVGTLILCLMDGVDITLSAAKVLKYLGFQTACDAMFGIFVVAWFIARHVIYNLVCLSVWQDSPVAMPYGCYDAASGLRLPSVQASVADSLAQSPRGREVLSNLMHAYDDTGTAGPVCFNPQIRNIFFGLLVCLQALMVGWFVMIARLVLKVIRGENANDDRSEDEEETDEDIPSEDVYFDKEDIDSDGRVDSKAPTHDGFSSDDEPVVVPPMPSASSWSFGGLPAAAARTSGVLLPMQANSQALLGRIGCEKPPPERNNDENRPPG